MSAILLVSITFKRGDKPKDKEDIPNGVFYTVAKGGTNVIGNQGDIKEVFSAKGGEPRIEGLLLRVKKERYRNNVSLNLTCLAIYK